jgi:hypothetical protein
MTMRRNMLVIMPGSYFRLKKRRTAVISQKKISSRLAIAASAVILATGLAISFASAASATTETPAAGAAAAAAPTISFSFTQQTVDSGAHSKLTYSGRNLPGRSGLFLQLAYGTPTHWYFARPLNGMTGTATLSGLPAGLYEFRVVAEQGITVVAISQTRYLSVVQPQGCGLICTILDGIGGVVLTWLLSLLW